MKIRSVILELCAHVRGRWTDKTGLKGPQQVCVYSDTSANEWPC